MGKSGEDLSSSTTSHQAIDLISAVKELHRLTSQELSKLLKDSENHTIHYLTADKTSPLKIDVEKLAGFLPLHLIAVLLSSQRDEALLRYLLSGIRLLHTLCDLAPRHPKLEQILFDDVKVSEHMLDLVVYLLIVLGGYPQENHSSSLVPLHSTLVACTFHLLTGCISSQWQDIAQVLVAHPKVDVFMDAAFGAVQKTIRFLHVKLSGEDPEFCISLNPAAEQIITHLCQQCEASVQFLQLLCQQKLFRERLLKNKELCGNGGVLYLVQGILKLNVTPAFAGSFAAIAVVSRLKARVLSVLLHLCEAESVSYLDEVASSIRSMDLAKSVALEVLEILKASLNKDPKYLGTSYSMGHLQLNAMRLADIFSDDSNFRSYVMSYFTEVLTAIFSLSHGDFLSMWCSSKPPIMEEDGTMDYDLFAAVGWVLESSPSSKSTYLEMGFAPINMSQASYAHQRTSLFVKVIANLHCFVPNICEEQERNYFLNKFLEGMQTDPAKSLSGFFFTSDAHKPDTVCRNLRSLLSHAESLISSFLIEDDVQLLRVFYNQLKSQIAPDVSDETQELQSAGGLLPQPGQASVNLGTRNGSLKEEVSENSDAKEVDLFNIKNEQMRICDVVIKDEKAEDEVKSSGNNSVSIREIDREIVHVETSGSDMSPARGKSFAGQTDNSEFSERGDYAKAGGFGVTIGDATVDIVQISEKQPRKRKRTIMNDKQISLMEEAVLDEPEMQRHANLLQSWAEKLSLHGPEITPSQIKNWLNNRKARLARAGKDARVSTEVEILENSLPEKQGMPLLGYSLESTEVPGEAYDPSNGRGSRSISRIDICEKSVNWLTVGTSGFLYEDKVGRHVVLVDGQGEEIGIGRVYQVHGQWAGRNLIENKICVTDVTQLKAEKQTKLPYPSEAAGTSFEEAEIKIGVMRVLWDINKLILRGSTREAAKRSFSSV